MQEITPVGILSENASASLEFYRKVLRIERVQIQNLVENNRAQALLRLESPKIEVNCTETRISDRPGKARSQINQRLKFWCTDADELKVRLKDNRIAVFENSGRASFLDLNGINWDICSA